MHIDKKGEIVYQTKKDGRQVPSNFNPKTTTYCKLCGCLKVSRAIPKPVLNPETGKEEDGVVFMWVHYDYHEGKACNKKRKEGGW